MIDDLRTRPSVREDAERRLLAAFATSAPIGMVLLDREGRYVRISRHARGPAGGRARVGRRLQDLFPAVWAQCRPHFDRVIAEALPRQFTVEISDPDSPWTAQAWEIGYFPVQDEDGEVLGVAATAADVSERVQAEARAAALLRALDEQRALFEAMFTDSQVGKAFLDREGHFVFVNEALTKMTRLPAAAHIGRRVREVLGDEAAAALDPAVEEVLVHGEPRQVEISCGGGTEGVSSQLVLSLYSIRVGGDHVGVGAVVLDVSAHRATENQLRELNERLGEYVSVASHEIRRPLTSVYGFGLQVARLIESPTRSAAELREAITMLIGEAERLNRTVDLFLDLALVDSGQFAGARSDIDLTELIVVLLPEYRRRYPSATILLALDEEPVVARTNAVAVTQIISNLVDNAVKYAGAGARVRISLMREETQCIVRVWDNGPGISPEVREHLFERYYRGPDRRQHGLGIGLYVSRRLARDVGGELSAAAPSEGAEFVLTLPASIAPSISSRDIA